MSEQPPESPLLDENGRVLPISLITDEPVHEQDTLDLGMDVWAQIVAGVATGTEGPFTIGLFAPWGQGKTSILNSACFKSSFADNTHAFVVNAWEHERHPDPLKPILLDILRSIDTRLDSETDPRRRKSLSALKKVITILTLSTAAIALGAPTVALAAPAAAELVEELGSSARVAFESAQAVSDAVTALSPASGTEGSDVGTGTRALLHRAKEAFMPNEKVIVFIDDLDRCQPDKAVALLESIKHLLWVQGFVFVLALDNVVLENFLQRRYERDFGLDHDPAIGKRYLEKLVQLTIFLPESNLRFSEYVRSLLQTEGGHWRLPEELLDILVIGARNNPRNLKRRVNDLIVDLLAYRAIRGDETNDFSDIDAVKCLAMHRLMRDSLHEEELRLVFNSHDIRQGLLSKFAGESNE